MEENQRLIKLIDYLKNEKIVHNQKHFVDLIGSDVSTISQILNDKKSG